MYLLIVLLLMFVLPTGSIYLEHSYLHSAAPLMLLAGKWFVFWSAGVRLVMAGLRQYFQPRFTSEQIFDIKGDEALPIVRELGVANLATGVVGVASLAEPTFAATGGDCRRHILRRRGHPACCRERQNPKREYRDDQRPVRLFDLRCLRRLLCVHTLIKPSTLPLELRAAGEYSIDLRVGELHVRSQHASRSVRGNRS